MGERFRHDSLPIRKIGTKTRESLPPRMDPEDTAHWTDSITRGMGSDSELLLAAKHELEEIAGEPETSTVDALAKRFDEVDQISPKRRALYYWVPIGLALILSLAIGIPTILLYRGAASFFGSFSGHSISAPGADDMFDLSDQLTDKERLYVYGDENQPNSTLAAKALWEAYPDDPILFGAYIATCETLPENILELAEKVDPENGWYHLVLAGEISKDAIEKKERSHSDPITERLKVSDWEITDEAKFQNALKLVRQGISKPRLENYSLELLQKRLEILPPEKNYISRIARIVFAVATQSNDSLLLINVAELLSCQAYVVGESNDIELLQELIPFTKEYLKRLSKVNGHLVLHLVSLANATSTCAHLAEACEKTGLIKEAQQLENTYNTLRRIKKRDFDTSEFDLIHKHGELLGCIMSPALGKVGAAPPTLEELKPGRMMNHALIDRLLLWSAVYNHLFFLLPLLAIPYLRGKLPFLLAKRFTSLLAAKDWFWIIGLGVIMPFIWYFAITRLTPLGCRDWSVVYSQFQPFATQATLAMYLSISATLVVSRWRLGHFTIPIGISRKPFSVWLLLTIALALAIPGAGLMRYDFIQIPMIPVIVSVAFVIVTLYWLLFLTIRTLFSKRRWYPHRAAISLILAPAYAITILIFIALVPLTHHSERYWIARDSYFSSSAENHGMSRAEADATAHLRREIKKALAQE